MTDRQIAADYIGSLARQLALMARHRGMGFLAYLLELVCQQAIMEGTQSRDPQG
jgi:hypothetical protein